MDGAQAFLSSSWTLVAGPDLDIDNTLFKGVIAADCGHID